MKTSEVRRRCWELTAQGLLFALLGLRLKTLVRKAPDGTKSPLSLPLLGTSQPLSTALSCPRTLKVAFKFWKQETSLEESKNFEMSGCSSFV